MKKLFAMLAALLLLCGCAALAETGVEKADYLGQWNAVSVSMMGVEFTVEEAGLTGFALTVGPETAEINIGGETGASPTTYEGDTLMFRDGDLALSCTIVEGRMHMAMAIDGIPLTIILERVAAEAPVVEEPVVEDTVEEPVAEAPANPFIGQWNGVTVSMLGVELPVAEVGLTGMALRVEQGTAYLTMGGEEGSCATSYEGDTMVFTDGTDSIVCTIVEGKLHMVVSDMTIIMERVAVEEPVVEEPVVEEPVVEEPVAEAPANPFIGQWNGVTVSMMGMEFPVAEVGLTGMALRVEQGTAYLTMGGEEGSCATSYEGDTMVFTNGTDSIVCTIVDGKLHMAVSDMTIIMERVAVEEPVVEEPVVEEPVAEAPANPFVGQWNGVTVSMLGIEFPVAEVGLNGTALRVEAATAHLTMDGGETSCAALLEGDALVFTRGSDRIVCTIVEGKLHMAIGDMTIIMERVGGTEVPVVEPVVEEVVEEPVVEESVVEDTTEEPVVEAPANPFAGQWNSTTVSMMGIEFPVAEVGLNGTALRVEAATACLTMNGGETSCPATLEGDTLVFTHGSDRIVCTIVGGKLHMAIGDMTIIMERVGGAAPQTPAVTPATPAQTPVAAVGFDGRWQAKSVTTLGMSFTAQELAMDGYVLVVSGAKAQLMVNGSVTMELTATMNGDTMTLSNGKDTLSATLASDGTLRLNMTEGGLEYTLQMEREGGAVAAGAECDFCGKKYVEGTGHTVDGLVVCPTCYTRFFD